MKIHDVMNLSFADLKSQRAEVLEAAKSADDISERFVQALTDAKQRDEKLSEQGVTITNLNEMVESLRSDVALWKQSHEAERINVERLQSEGEYAATLVKTLQSDLEKEKARADRLKAEAIRNATALTTAEKALKDAIAQQQVETVDTGE